MPLWRIFSHPETFSAGQKAALARDITALYHEAAGLPKFYVGVVFIPLEAENIWVGGERRENFVRIVVEQIARYVHMDRLLQGRSNGWDVDSCLLLKQRRDDNFGGHGWTKSTRYERNGSSTFMRFSTSEVVEVLVDITEYRL